MDIRIITFNIISQEVMTADNVPCSIDGVVFFKINNPEKAVLEVEEYKFAITQLSQAAFKRCLWKSRVGYYYCLNAKKWERILKPLLNKKLKSGVLLLLMLKLKIFNYLKI